MPGEAPAGEVREAVQDLHAYLSDQIAPLLVAGSVELLVGQPPVVTAEAIRSWVSGQLLHAHAATLPLADYLFHAVKKLELLGRHKLLEPEVLERFLGRLSQELVMRAPPAERSALLELLQRASAVEVSAAMVAQSLHLPGATRDPAARQQPAGGGSALPIPGELATNLRQFNVLLARLTSLASSGAGKGAAAGIAAQVLAAAAQSAGSQAELDAHLATLNDAGLAVESRDGELFAALSDGLPEWFVAPAEAAAEEPAPVSASSEAMHRIVALAEEPGRTLEHFRGLLRAGARQFNAGSLARAVQVLEVAARLVAERRVDPPTAEVVLGTAHEDLDPAQLMAQTQHAANLPHLRRLLTAYPGLRPDALLDLLEVEPDRSRRRLLIALLEVHGAPARQAALARLQRSFEDPEVGPEVVWLRRNSLHLLHRIAPGDEDAELEVGLSRRAAELDNPAPLVREALIHLGHRRHPLAEATLCALLEQLGAMVEAGAGAAHEPAELRRMLGIVVNGLVQHDTPGAHRALVDHGLAASTHQTERLERLAELGAVDLAGDPEAVERLLSALRARLPRRLFGVSFGRLEQPYQLVQALRSTRTPAVRELFLELRSRFAGEAFAELAAAALVAWDAPPTAARGDGPAEAGARLAGLTGDLDMFTLPELLQTLAASRATGRLVLRDQAATPFGEMVLCAGALREARVRRLAMPDAFYELVEVPRAGTFEFMRQSAAELSPGADLDLVPLLMEAVRRCDELQRARLLAPDDARLQPTGTRATPRPDESDGVFIRDLWTAVKSGATPRECETTLRTDCYRVRALLAHWVAEGALAIAPASTAS